MSSILNLFSELEKTPSESPSILNLFTEANPPPAPPPPAEPKPSAVEFDDDYVFWAMRDIPVKEAATHFLICGSSGSGKTTTIQLFLQSIASRFREGRNPPEQLILYDAKCDLIPILAALDLRPEHENVWILNPFDARTASWNLSASMSTPGMGRYLATLLVPEEKNTTAPYFSNAARELACAVIDALNFIRRTAPADDPKDWTFRDLLCAMDSTERIAAITGRYPPAERDARPYLNDDKHIGGVFSTLASKLARFKHVAALWHSKPDARPFSVSEFLAKPGVLILGSDPVLNESLWPINAILLRALANEILRGPETRTPRHWFVLDEFRAMRRVDCIHELLNLGRSKGASVLIGLQSIDGLIEVYGEQVAEDILSNCANKTFLRAGGPKTAEWAEKFFSKIRHTEQTVTESWGSGPQGNSYSYSIQQQLQDRSLFVPSVFLNIPFPMVGGDYVAISDVPCANTTFITERSFDEILSWSKKPADAKAIDRRIDPNEETLWPWNADEELKFIPGMPSGGDGDSQKGKSSKPSSKSTKPKAKRDRDDDDHDLGIDHSL